MTIDPVAMENLLRELGEWLRFEETDPIELVVCGGMALALQGLSRRATQDVDVLGTWRDDDRSLECVGELPPVLRSAMKRVIASHPELEGLGARWINLGPRQLAEWGLPAGYETRLTALSFGSHLRLHLLGRRDLIALKLFAASDQAGARRAVHISDLERLDPTDAELDAAVQWIQTLGDPQLEIKLRGVREVLEGLGRDDLAYYV